MLQLWFKSSDKPADDHHEERVKPVAQVSKDLEMPAQIQSAIRSQAAYDVDPDVGETAQYIRNEMSLAGYKYLLAVGKHSKPHLSPDWWFRLGSQKTSLHTA